MITIPKAVSDRLSKQVGVFQKVLKSAIDRDVNESDTVTIITDMLASVFGFDKYTEITREQVIKGTYCDLAIKINGVFEYLIEVKAIGLELKQDHTRQAVNYGASQGIKWVVLTNGIHWKIYKITVDQQVDVELLCEFNFLELSTRSKEDQGKLFMLCKKGLAKGAIEQFSKRAQSINPYTIAALLTSEAALGLIRRELRKIAKGLKVNDDEIRKIIESQILKREVVVGDLAAAAKKLVKKAMVKAAKPKRKETGIATNANTQLDN